MAISIASDLLTRQQAAEYLNIKAQTLAVWACSGREVIPLVRIGRRSVRYKKSDLDRYIASRTVGTLAE